MKKKQILRAFTALSLSAFLFGCETADKEIYSRTVQIESVPTGAPIIIDGLQMGKAPLGVGVETTEGGNFVRRTSITAVPLSDDLHTQVITFPAYTPENGDKSAVPAKITFYMQKNPAESDSVVVESESSF